MKFLISYLCFCCLLMGCATAPVVQSPEQLSKTHGYVFAYFPKTGAGNNLTLMPVGGKESFSLLKRKESKGWGRWLPAGEYKISRWAAYEWGEYEHITVKAGQVTDLGSLITIQLGGYDFVVLPVRPVEAAAAVQAPIVEYTNYLSSLEPLLWSPTLVPKTMRQQAPSSGLGLVADLIAEYDRSVNKPSVNKQLTQAKDINSFFAIAKSGMPPTTDDVPTDNNGNLYFGTDFGQLRVRSKQGNWSSLDTGSLSAITAVDVSPLGILAGFENGFVRLSKDLGKTWTVINNFSSDESILDIDYVDNKFMIITGVFKTKQLFNSLIKVSLYASKKSDFSDMKSIYIHEIQDPSWGVVVRGEYSNGQYLFNAPFDLFKVDLNSLVTTKISPPKKIHSFHIAENSKFLVSWLAQGAFSKAYISENLGISWQEINTPPYIINDILFKSESVGVAIRFNPGVFTVTPEYYSYDKNNNKWVKSHDGLTGCTKMLHDDKNVTKFCVSGGGNIFGLDRETNKWKAEFLVD